MIGWPLSPAWVVACRFGDESQQPIFPHVMHMRRCTQPLPIFRHSSHPSMVSGSSVTSIWSRWLQIGLADMPPPFSACKDDCEVAQPVGPPRTNAQPCALELPFESVPPELRADLDAKPLSP